MHGALWPRFGLSCASAFLLPQTSSWRTDIYPHTLTHTAPVLAGRACVPQVLVVAQDERRLWLATDEDNAKYKTVNAVNTMNRKVTVRRVQPGAPPPPSPKGEDSGNSDSDGNSNGDGDRHTASCDYWYDQWHTREHYAFMSILDSDAMPIACAATALPQAAVAKGKGASGKAPASQRAAAAAAPAVVRDPTTPLGLDARLSWAAPQAPRAAGSSGGSGGSGGGQHGGKEVLHVLELCAGAGGLSFLCQENDGVRIESKWAVDIDESSCCTFQVRGVVSVLKVFPAKQPCFIQPCSIQPSARSA